MATREPADSGEATVDKPFIKWVLILTFLVTISFVFVSAWQVLWGSPRPNVVVTPPDAPGLTDVPPLPAQGKAEEIDAAMKKAQQVVDEDRKKLETYAQQVTAYTKDVEAAKANANANARLSAFEKVIKETLGPLIVTPLLGALILYSGIKVAGNVAIAKITRQANSEVNAP